MYKVELRGSKDADGKAIHVLSEICSEVEQMGSVTSCLEICPRNAFLAPPGPHRSEGVAGTEMRAGRRKKHWRRNRDITEKAYPFCSDSISILWSWLALSPLFV